jgi:IS5 family transposase
MNLVIPWPELLVLIAPHAPACKAGRPPFATEEMLGVHFLQQFFGHSNPAIRRLPEGSTILRFRHLLEEHGLGQQILATVNAKLIERVLMFKTGTVVDATPVNALRVQLEELKVSIRAKVEHPFRVIKCQFGRRKVRYRGLTKNTSQLLVMFALSNLWMMRKRILQGLQA